jgi:hypothetical protein
VQVPSPFTDRMAEPPKPKIDMADKMATFKKQNTLKELVKDKRAILKQEELEELTELETKKYKTRCMLNDILGAQNVKRSTKNPSTIIGGQSKVNPII